MEGVSSSLKCGVAMLLLLVAPLPAQQTGRSLRADAGASRIYVITHRTGLLSFLGHEHVILAPRWSATLCWDAPSHAGSHAEIVIDARALDIDADSARALAGLGKGPSAQQRAQIQRKLHAERNLDSERYPELRFRSSSVRAIADTLFIQGMLTVRNQARAVELLAIVQQRGGTEFWLTGRLRVRQSDFGIRPESIAGVVKVADVVDIHVGLLAIVTAAAC